MVNNKKESFFWTSYSDLMTSLFFVMLVLFILTIVLLQRSAKADKEKLAKIERLNNSTKKIDPNYFLYDSTYMRHTLKNVDVSFRSNSSDITDINPADRERLLLAGKAILSFLEVAKYSIKNAKYLLIIEGQSSRDSYTYARDPLFNNDVLSYRRSLALVRDLWGNNGIDFFHHDICEIIISGSGHDSKFRVSPDILGNEKNQRFVIHIIPKPGNFE